MCRRRRSGGLIADGPRDNRRGIDERERVATPKKPSTAAAEAPPVEAPPAKRTAATRAAPAKAAPKRAAGAKAAGTEAASSARARGTKGAKKAAPKKAARRADYDAPIGPWFDQQPAEKRPALDRLRAIVESTVPDARPGLRWSVPFWSLDGTHLCNLVTLKHEVALGIYAPPEAFDDPQGQLSGRSKEYRVLKVRTADEIDPASVERWLLAAVAAR
jgi:hypothetical protein